MDFDELYKSIILSESSILNLVDEYTLYCYYTGISPLVIGKAYEAPYYRLDKVPSFSIYESKSNVFEYMWKDHATGDYGNIFNLVQLIEQLPDRKEVLARINEDFCLGYNTPSPIQKEKIVLYEKPERNDIKIQIVSKPFSTKGLEFWRQFDIGEALLNLYKVTEVDYYWKYVNQAAPTTAVTLTFAYQVGAYYQLYSPFAPKKYKFRNDLPENYFFGYLQLPRTMKKLVIDKSSKDVIFCRRLNLNAVAGKSETTFIQEHKILELKERAEEVYLCLDNDLPGRKQADKYMSLYPWMKCRFLPEHLAKDKTDLAKKVGVEEAERIVNQMLQ